MMNKDAFTVFKNIFPDCPTLFLTFLPVISKSGKTLIEAVMHDNTELLI
jgi:hypothetical protein